MAYRTGRFRHTRCSFKLLFSLLLVSILLFVFRQISSRPAIFNREHPLIRVEATGRLTERVSALNAVIHELAFKIRTDITLSSWKDEISRFGALAIIRGSEVDYTDKLRNCPSVTTVVLPWLDWQTTKPSSWSSTEDFSNVLYQTYYEWTGDNRLCTWIETPGKTPMRYDLILNRTCNRRINDTAAPQSLSLTLLNAKPIMNADDKHLNLELARYPRSGLPSSVAYVHIHRDAIVTEVGDVFSNNCKVVLDSCREDVSTSLPWFVSRLPLHDEVFVIAQFWGTSIFHRMVEVMPRTALFLQFLKSNPGIMILAPESNGGPLAELFRIVGLDPARLVSGMVRANVVYQPKSTSCGYANIQDSQVLSTVYRNYIKINFPNIVRNRLLLIQRTASRRFTEQKEIERIVKQAASEYGLRYTVFPDDPTPSLNETMRLFNSAVMVVAPHGAGESNLYFSEPGTYVIEGVCNLPHVNLCLQYFAHVLGHHWHGIASRSGCLKVLDVASFEVQHALYAYLQLWSQEQQNQRSSPEELDTITLK